MAYFSDPTPTNLCICLTCGALIPTSLVVQESDGEPEIDARELHLEWHREYKTYEAI